MVAGADAAGADATVAVADAASTPDASGTPGATASSPTPTTPASVHVTATLATRASHLHTRLATMCGTASGTG